MYSTGRFFGMEKQAGGEQQINALNPGQRLTRYTECLSCHIKIPYMHLAAKTSTAAPIPCPCTSHRHERVLWATAKQQVPLSRLGHDYSPRIDHISRALSTSACTGCPLPKTKTPRPCFFLGSVHTSRPPSCRSVCLFSIRRGAGGGVAIGSTPLDTLWATKKRHAADSDVSQPLSQNQGALLMMLVVG